MAVDPFENDPFADEAQAKPAPKAKTTRKKENKTLSAENEAASYTGTFKGGSGFDAPWLVVRGSSAVEYKELVEAADEEGLFELTAEKAKEFAAKYGPPAKPAAASSSRPAARKAPSRSSSDAPTCDCGEPAGYTEFQSKAGKTVKAYKCQVKIDDYRATDGCEFFQWAN
ncbi:hypothetical protein [Nonomuraea sp. NPDC049141]|uniref:hypothetical protein n=1 Tax=Nonomuraea sp. NPDC049141 TaxID=3155500 RepID=UPI0034090FCD